MGRLITSLTMVCLSSSVIFAVYAKCQIAGFTFDKMLHTTPDDAWDIIMKIHVRAPFRIIRQAAPHFRLKVCSLCPDSQVTCLHLTWHATFSARRTRKPIHHQRFFYFRPARKCRTGELCSCQSSRNWTHKNHCEGVGPLRCPC